MVLNQEIQPHKLHKHYCLFGPAHHPNNTRSEPRYIIGSSPHQLVKAGTKELTKPILPTVADKNLGPSPLQLVKARTKRIFCLHNSSHPSFIFSSFLSIPPPTSLLHFAPSPSSLLPPYPLPLCQIRLQTSPF